MPTKQPDQRPGRARYTVVETVLCPLTLVADDDHLLGVRFERSPDPPHPPLGRRVEVADHAILENAHTQLIEYLAGTRRDFDLPLRPEGDTFSVATWTLLRDIPYGETTTYGEIAGLLGNRQLAQRVGQVIGRNPIGIVIPCHRVIGADGSLTGFGGGLDRKRRLLDLEEPAERRALRLF
ncbi:methylated-DNA--[protein]-cysteine S-methyltransferase [Gordonia sp. NPDC003424]